MGTHTHTQKPHNPLGLWPTSKVPLDWSSTTQTALGGRHGIIFVSRGGGENVSVRGGKKEEKMKKEKKESVGDKD